MQLPGVALSPTKLREGIKHMIDNLGAKKSNNLSVIPSALELQDFNEATKKLWDLDVNRLSPGTDYVLNMQSGHTFHDRRDTAPERMFSFVDLKALERPTFKAFRALLDNYTTATGILLFPKLFR